MAVIDDTILTMGAGGLSFGSEPGGRRPPGPGGLEVVNPLGRRRITLAIHDVDGTHSIIREWPPVMSAVLRYAMTCGLGGDFDSPANLEALAGRIGREAFEETDRFCIESAGLSALTQMEYAIRRAVELGRVPAEAGIRLTGEQRQANAEICRRIWAGQERFDDLDEPEELRRFIAERTPRLFRFYEQLLNRHCRDRNLAAARRDPAAWRVAGSLEFLSYLRDCGCRNFFVTGAVIFQGGGMFEEIEALGYTVGPGMLVEEVLGSSWERKQPKDELFARLIRAQNVPPGQVLVVGDGRTEIRAAVELGGAAMSRLPAEAAQQRRLHRELGTNYIVEDFTSPALRQLVRTE